ncbi:MAG: ferritin [Bacillota bacterium]|nr:ferritin [Bacillota bacterium]
MLSEKLQEMLNEQISKEFYSAYLYLSIEAYFLSLNLNGFANWFHVQVQEEKDHAMLMYNYLAKVGGRIILKEIAAPKVEFVSIEDALKTTLEHEQFVTRSIYDIVDASILERDHKINYFLQWFVNEQTEEEANAENNLKKFMIVGNDGKGILMMDSELATRVYVPITSTQTQSTQP